MQNAKAPGQDSLLYFMYLLVRIAMLDAPYYNVFLKIECNTDRAHKGTHTMYVSGVTSPCFVGF